MGDFSLFSSTLGRVERKVFYLPSLLTLPLLEVPLFLFSVYSLKQIRPSHPLVYSKHLIKTRGRQRWLFVKYSRWSHSFIIWSRVNHRWEKVYIRIQSFTRHLSLVSYGGRVGARLVTYESSSRQHKSLNH